MRYETRDKSGICTSGFLTGKKVNFLKYPFFFFLGFLALFVWVLFIARCSGVSNDVDLCCALLAFRSYCSQVARSSVRTEPNLLFFSSLCANLSSTPHFRLDQAGGVLAENPDEEDTEQDIMALLAEVDVVNSYGLKSNESHSGLPGGSGGALPSSHSDTRHFVAPSQQGGRGSSTERAAAGTSTTTATAGAPSGIRSAMKRNVPFVAFPSVAEVVERATQGGSSSGDSISTGPKKRSRVLSNHHIGLSAGAMKYSSEMLRNRFGQNMALLSGDDGFDDSLLAC